MGKWTLEYHDEVLRNKVKNLVQGAIKRMNVEEEKPFITYEAFVEDLDEGDSFTTSLVDVLVKELAERRTRPNPTDRRLISERTAKSLRMQAAPLHVYRGSPGTLRVGARRSVPIPPPRSYSNFHDLLSDSDPEEEYGTMLGTAGQLEGARLNTDLYDAYASSTYDLPGSLSRASERLPSPPQPHPSESTTSGGTWLMSSSGRSSLYSTSGPAWTGHGGPGSSLSRSSTIRRSHRNRSTDISEFTSFTSRRRSAIRNSATQEDGSRDDSSTDTPGRSASVDNTRSMESSAALSDVNTRRPWDLSALTRRRMPSTSPLHDESRPSAGSNPSSSQMWYSLTSSASDAAELSSVTVLPRRSSTTDLNDDRRQAIAPRLRRGGLRPPEVLLPTSNQDFLDHALTDHGAPDATRRQPDISEEVVAEQPGTAAIPPVV